MKPINDYNEIPETTDRERLAAGGYVLKLIEAKDNANKDYFELIYDIAEGPEKGRYGDDWGKEHPYMHRFYRSYKESSKKMFKAFISAVEKSNNCELASKVIAGTLTEADLKGKLVGAVIGYEQYTNDRGETKERTYIDSVMSADRIRNNCPPAPPLKTAEGGKSATGTTNGASSNGNAIAGFTPVKNEEIPFDDSDLPF